MTSRSPKGFQILPFRDLLHGASAYPAGMETAMVAYPITTTSVSAPTGRRAVLFARRLYIPETIVVRGIQWANDGGTAASVQARRIKAAIFSANGNTGHWEGVDNVDTGLPSTVHPQLKMAQSVLVGPHGTNGTAENLWRGAANGNQRGMRLRFDSDGEILARSWIWVLIMAELMYDTTDGAAKNMFPRSSAAEVLTPHAKATGAVNARNLVWNAQIGDGTTAALSATDIAGTAWSNFENKTTEWVNQTSDVFTLSGNGVNMACKDFYGSFLMQWG